MSGRDRGKRVQIKKKIEVPLYDDEDEDDDDFEDEGSPGS